MSLVLFDVDTQLDFLYPAGSLYVPGAEAIVANLGRLTAWAARAGHPIVSTMDAHTEADPEFASWPHHCVAGCLGQRKAQATIAPAGAVQHFVPKVHVNCFTNAGLPGLLDELAPERYVVYGVVTEVCVHHAVEGLLARGAAVTLVTDAIRELDPAAARALIESLTARGGALTTTAALTGQG